MLVSLTVGKVDAGVAVLLTDDKRLIEFPSILLPQSITCGSIVDITVSQNRSAEQKAEDSFAALQSRILNTYGLHAPQAPVLRLRNATQTSLVLEWDPIELATSKLRSLALYRNGSKAGNIPRPMEMLSTKISGLALDTEYSFYLVLRTSGGTLNSNVLTVKTHSMDNLTGITVTPGVLPSQLRESLEVAVKRIGAKIVDTVRIDTTHFICTEGRGKDWEKANEMNIPVVRPEWIEGCEREGKIIGVRGYYLDANPKHRQIGSNPAISTNNPSQPQPQPRQQQQQPTQSQQQSQQQPQQQRPPQTPTAAPKSSSQTNIPLRNNPSSPDPRGSAAGEPGPEVLPAQPPKAQIASPLPTTEEEDEEDSDKEEESPGEEDEADDDEGSAKTPRSNPAKSPPPLTSPAKPAVDKSKAAKVTDEKEGGDMEDVAL